MNLYEYKIMLVDDEAGLRKMVKEFLEKAGFNNVVTAGSCKEAREVFYRERPQLVLLDVMLGDGDGFMLLGELHRESQIPVIFLSAKDEDENRLRGLGMGADDYIVKPFLPQELILRVAAVLRRVYRIADTNAQQDIVLGNCRIDLGSGVVHREDGELTLTAKEYAILKKLEENRGRIVTIDALCEAVWQEGNYGYENTLIVHIRRLREKIEENPSHPEYLLTVRGLGYKLVH